MPVMSLHKIKENIGNILTRIDDEEDDTRVQLLQAELDALEMAWDEKVDNIVRFIRSLEAEAKALREEANYFLMRARSTENKARRLRDYLRDELAGMRQKKVKVGHWRLYLQSHKRVEVVDLENVPEFFPTDLNNFFFKSALSLRFNSALVTEPGKFVLCFTRHLAFSGAQFPGIVHVILMIGVP